MGKRLVSTNGRAETIVGLENPDNISAFFNDAVTDSIMPAYSDRLRVECLYLLDLVTDGAKNWKGNRMIYLDGTREIDVVKRQTIGRSITWLSEGHHIKDNTVLRNAVAPFCKESIPDERINNYVKSEIELVRNKLIAANVEVESTDLHGVVDKVLNHWDLMWDYSEAYSVIGSSVYLTKRKLDDLDALTIIRLVQSMEYQYVKECMNERL